jgi:hypothetical protein
MDAASNSSPFPVGAFCMADNGAARIATIAIVSTLPFQFRSVL